MKRPLNNYPALSCILGFNERAHLLEWIYAFTLFSSLAFGLYMEKGVYESKMCSQMYSLDDKWQVRYNYMNQNAWDIILVISTVILLITIRKIIIALKGQRNQFYFENQINTFKTRVIIELILSPLCILFSGIGFGMFFDSLFMLQMDMKGIFVGGLVAFSFLMFGTYRPKTILDIDGKRFVKKGLIPRKIAFSNIKYLYSKRVYAGRQNVNLPLRYINTFIYAKPKWGFIPFAITGNDSKDLLLELSEVTGAPIKSK